MNRIEGLRKDSYFDMFRPTIGIQNSKQLLNRNTAHNHGYDYNDQYTAEDKDRLNTAVEAINKTIDVFDRGLEFSVHEETNRLMVKVIDRSEYEDRVIREIPPEKILDLLAEALNIIGLLIDKRI